MQSHDKSLIDRIAAGERVSSPEEVTPAYRAELMRLIVVFVDSELAGAAGFAEQINAAPGMKERAVAARMVAEKFAHAEKALDLLAPFGISPEVYVRSHAWNARLNRALDLGTRRVGGDKRLNVFHYPIEGWIDAVTMNMLMGSASAIQLAELIDCSYAPLAEAMSDIVRREAAHAALGESGLAQAIDRDGSTASAQASVNYWYPRVVHTFGRSDSDRYELYSKYGLRRSTNAKMLAAWQDEVRPRLGRLGLDAPSSAA